FIDSSPVLIKLDNTKGHNNPIGAYYDRRCGIYRIFQGGGRAIHVNYDKRCPNNFIGLKVHDEQPQYYYECKKDLVVFGRCPYLHVFDKTSNKCRYQRYVDLDVDIVPAKCTKEGKFPVRTNCSLYYICDKNGKEFRTKVFRCPGASVYSPDTRRCSSTGTCSPSTVIYDDSINCPEVYELSFPGCSDQGIYRTRTDCSLYYNCSYSIDYGFIETRYMCPTGKAFSIDHQTCLPKSNVLCEGDKISEYDFGDNNYNDLDDYDNESLDCDNTEYTDEDDMVGSKLPTTRAPDTTTTEEGSGDSTTLATTAENTSTIPTTTPAESTTTTTTESTTTTHIESTTTEESETTEPISTTTESETTELITTSTDSETTILQTTTEDVTTTVNLVTTSKEEETTASETTITTSSETTPSEVTTTTLEPETTTIITTTTQEMETTTLSTSQPETTIPEEETTTDITTNNPITNGPETTVTDEIITTEATPSTTTTEITTTESTSTSTTISTSTEISTIKPNGTCVQVISHCDGYNGSEDPDNVGDPDVSLVPENQSPVGTVVVNIPQQPVDIIFRFRPKNKSKGISVDFFHGKLIDDKPCITKGN
ncbi:hypothetical protein ACFFRR_009868, partial [Megaselia abdita]